MDPILMGRCAKVWNYISRIGLYSIERILDQPADHIVNLGLWVIRLHSRHENKKLVEFHGTSHGKNERNLWRGRDCRKEGRKESR